MLVSILVLGLALQSASPDSAQPKQDKQEAGQAEQRTGSDSNRSNDLVGIKRIYVDSFGEDETSREVQSMIVTALVATNRFVVTENRDRADAILRGVALEKTSQELHAYSEGTAVGARNGAAAIKDSAAHTETVHDANVSVRLINRDGDVVWTTTQESKGGKYKGATADAADSCVKQLLRDIQKVKNNDASAPQKSTTQNPPPTSSSQK